MAFKQQEYIYIYTYVYIYIYIYIHSCCLYAIRLTTLYQDLRRSNNKNIYIYIFLLFERHKTYNTIPRLMAYKQQEHIYIYVCVCIHIYICILVVCTL